MKRTSLAISLMLMIFVTASASGNDTVADTFTSASTTNYYGPAADFQYLELATFNGVVVSTTNPDGSPNAAVLIPSVFEEKYLIMRMAPNQTVINLATDGRAVVTLFTPAGPEEETPTRADVRKYGARLICIALFEGEEYEEIRSRWNDTVENEAYKLPAGEPILRIEDIQPVG